ncbi:MAG: restriction endonuclease subunit S, partial [Thioclava sp.]|nr:restriction endonuclease subunit S [Thioclava sp.]
MAGEWRTRTFGECAMLVRETVLPTEAAGSRYVGLEHIVEGGLRLNGIGTADDVTSAKSRFRQGDILFGKLRPYFRKVVRARFDGVSSTDIWVVRPRQDIDCGYLFYWMASKEFVDAATRGSEGTKMPRAKWDFIAGLSQPVPPLPEQRAIAHILGTLDDKIELNRRMNETLEAMARALFKSWFVDFDPVRAKMEGRDPGLPKHIADLFPARLVDSELGEIPEGWEV